MKAIGKMIYNMVKVKSHGLMGLCITEAIKQGKRMDMVFINGTMVVSMKDNGLRTK